VLRIRPASRITAAQPTRIRAHCDTLKRLLDEVDERRERFRQQLEASAAPVVPAFLFKPVPYVASVCFSCGDANGRATFGRCWRCSLAWRLACRLAIPANLAAAIDDARQLA
jgi:hypothetical protein